MSDRAGTSAPPRPGGPATAAVRPLAQGAMAMVRLRLITPWVLLGWFGASMVILVVGHLIESATTGPIGPATDHPVVFRSTPLVAFVVLLRYFTILPGAFPFALGLGLTRRDFFAGTWLITLVEAAGCGIALTVLQAVEQAGGSPLVGLPLDGVPSQFAGGAGFYLLAAGAGLFMGAVLHRWGTLVASVVISGIATVPMQAYVALAMVEDRAAVGRWLTEGPQVYLLLVVAPPLLAAGLATATYRILRRSDG